MKRIVSIIFSLLLFVGFATPASAATQDTVMPYFTDIHSMIASLYIDEDTGKAECIGELNAKQDVPVEIVIHLDQKISDQWERLESWTNTDTRIVKKCGIHYIARGYSYRVTVQGFVYDTSGNIVESASATAVETYE